MIIQSSYSGGHSAQRFLLLHEQQSRLEDALLKAPGNAKLISELRQIESQLDDIPWRFFRDRGCMKIIAMDTESGCCDFACSSVSEDYAGKVAMHCYFDDCHGQLEYVETYVFTNLQEAKSAANLAVHYNSNFPGDILLEPAEDTAVVTAQEDWLLRYLK